MVTCLASYQPTGGQTGLKHQPACRPICRKAGRQVRLHSCRFDSGSGYKGTAYRQTGLQWCKPFLFFRVSGISTATKSTKFCSSIKWAVDRGLPSVNDCPHRLILLLSYLIADNHQAFSTSTTSGARTQRLGPTFEVYQNREGFKVLFLNN